jgi:hypothetical protein
MADRRTPDATLIKAVRILARTITSGDGVIAACLAEVATRLEELVQERRSISTLLQKVESLEAEIARLREERRWISVGERLPDDLRRVMVMAPGLYGAQVAWLLNGKWHDGIGYPDDAIDCRVTHWQPLPPGPEGEA